MINRKNVSNTNFVFYGQTYDLLISTLIYIRDRKQVHNKMHDENPTTSWNREKKAAHVLQLVAAYIANKNPEFTPRFAILRRTTSFAQVLRGLVKVAFARNRK